MMVGGSGIRKKLMDSRATKELKQTRLMMKKWKNKYDSDFHLVQLVDGGDIYKSKEYRRIEHVSQEGKMSSVLGLRVSRTFK